MGRNVRQVEHLKEPLIFTYMYIDAYARIVNLSRQQDYKLLALRVALTRALRARRARPQSSSRARMSVRKHLVR